MNRIRWLACVSLLVVSPEAGAHFALTTPPAYSVQDNTGLPQKSAPCGQADPSNAVVPTNMVTTYHTGDSITITIDEKIFHPGHYRVALAQDQASLPADPVATADGNSPCGTAAIQDSTTTGVLVDNMLPHTTAFGAPQSFQVTLPAGTTCTNCTLQIIEFMSNHALNNPGGCFYHHCAQVSIVPVETPLPDAGMTGSDPGTGGSGYTPQKVSGGCAVGGGSSAGALVVVGFLALRRRRARR